MHNLKKSSGCCQWVCCPYCYLKPELAVPVVYSLVCPFDRLLASFFITFLNWVKRQCSLGGHSQHSGRHKIGRQVRNPSIAELAEEAPAAARSHSSPLPAGTAFAAVELWSRSGKWTGLKLWFSFFHGLISEAHCTVQQGWPSSSAVEGGKGRLEDHRCLHGCVIHHRESLSPYCLHTGSRAMVFSPRAEGESSHCTKVQRES